MCGRYALQPGDKFYDRFNIENRLDTLVPRYNIAPGQFVPVIVSKSPNRVMAMKWGLIPHWVKEERADYKMINARLETVKEKPSYRGLIQSKRCLVPASGFYEWRATKQGKIPYYIYEKGNPLFAFAGLYDVWKNSKGEEIHTFTIITREANPYMARIHERMPVILRKNEEVPWIDKATDANTALRLIAGSAQIGLQAHPVSRQVNKPENDSADLLKDIQTH